MTDIENNPYDIPKKSEAEKEALAEQIVKSLLALNVHDRLDVLCLVKDRLCFACGHDYCNGVCQNDE